MTYIERIINAETNEITEREYTTVEIAEVEKAKVNLALEIEETLKAETDRATLLAKLGITADEAKLLLS
jgi:hypothetical protein